MNAQDDAQRWDDATRVAALLAIDAEGLGGACLRALPGPAREEWMNVFRSVLCDGQPIRRVPLNATDDRLLGGLDLAATLRAGHATLQRGLLAEADGGFVLLSMAERHARSTRAHIATMLDTGVLAVRRDGFALDARSRIGVIAFDESSVDDDPVGGDLLDRLAFLVDLPALRARAPARHAVVTRAAIVAARTRLPTVEISARVCEALCVAAMKLGVASIRPSLFAVRAARALAALAGEDEVSSDHAAIAARLVLSPRATIVPHESSSSKDADEDRAVEQTTMTRAADASADASARKDAESSDTPENIVVAAAAAAIPSGLLQRLRNGGQSNRPARANGRSGALQNSLLRGRPAGTRRGDPRGGARLDLIATLRAAAPWQSLRRNAASTARVEIRRRDFHVTRYKRRAQTVSIFIVDASGSSALERLAEAKGAVELLLAECYVRRDQVAVIVFRGHGAELLLPPTRSLVRAKRGLAGLPGGGGTPLAAAIDMALALGQTVRRAGNTATLIFLTDGRANIARDGSADRARATSEAIAASRRVRDAGIASVVIDISRRPQESAQTIAREMDATYATLPHASAPAISALAAKLARTTRAC